MFGYVTGNLAMMDEAQKARYRAAYCGLCREIGARSGQLARATLTYDLAFLVLLLSSLYEPQERGGRARCIVHPARRSGFFVNDVTAYGADMNVYLARCKCLDDWADEKSLPGRALAARLKRPCEAIELAWPRQCGRIRAELAALAAVERDCGPDEAVNRFGALMGELFVYDEDDHWADTLRLFGQGLGRFIYLMDAVLDYGKDVARGRANVLLSMDARPEDMHDTLTLLIGEAARAFEQLPLEQDLELLRNILYGGVWQRYNAAFSKRNGAERGAAND